MIVFLVGSIFWIVTSGLSLAPLIDPSHAPQRLVNKDSTITGFVGSVIFLIGAILLVFEVFNDAEEKEREQEKDTSWIAELVEEVYDEEQG